MTRRHISQRTLGLRPRACGTWLPLLMILVVACPARAEFFKFPWSAGDSDSAPAHHDSSDVEPSEPRPNVFQRLFASKKRANQKDSPETAAASETSAKSTTPVVKPPTAEHIPNTRCPEHVAAERVELTSAAAIADSRLAIEELRARVNHRLGTPLPRLSDPDFEDPSFQLKHWQFAKGDGIQVAVDDGESYQSKQSLLLRSTSAVSWANGPIVWVRSETITPPRSGQLAVWAWMKIPDEKQQPVVRMVLEGKLNGEQFYRWTELGADTGPVPRIPLREAWTPFLLHVDDLPSTGLTEVRIGFDLRGSGQVWIDDVVLYDLWLNERQHAGFLADIDVAEELLNEGRIRDCRKFLSAAWPQYVRKKIPLDASFEATLMAKKEQLEHKAQKIAGIQAGTSNERRLTAVIPTRYQPDPDSIMSIDIAAPRQPNARHESHAEVRGLITPLPPIHVVGEPANGGSQSR